MLSTKLLPLIYTPKLSLTFIPPAVNLMKPRLPLYCLDGRLNHSMCHCYPGAHLKFIREWQTECAVLRMLLYERQTGCADNRLAKMPDL